MLAARHGGMGDTYRREGGGMWLMMSALLPPRPLDEERESFPAVGRSGAVLDKAK